MTKKQLGLIQKPDVQLETKMILPAPGWRASKGDEIQFLNMDFYLLKGRIRILWGSYLLLQEGNA